MVIGFAIIWLFTFPTDLVLLVILFVLMSVYNRRCMLKRLGLLNASETKGVKGFFKSFFQIPTSSTMFGDSSSQVKYFCMSCGNEHKEISCPKCGSKMKRVG
jgi:rubrerythrin